MTEQHPITPPQELVVQWCNEWNNDTCLARSPYLYIADQAARWSADSQLDSVCEYLRSEMSPCDSQRLENEIRGAMRPKPPSLKEQALRALDELCVNHSKATDQEHTIRLALEALPEGPQ
jgi:hypothetical protein